MLIKLNKFYTTDSPPPSQLTYHVQQLLINEHDLDRTIFENENGFSMINTRLLYLGTKSYVLTS
jgi:hypothetical protein